MGYLLDLVFNLASTSPDEIEHNFCKWTSIVVLKVSDDCFPFSIKEALLWLVGFSLAGFAGWWLRGRVSLGKPGTIEPASTFPIRIPLTEFMALARDDGWDISGKTNVQILDLMDGLRQSFLDGAVRVWGRNNRYNNQQLVNLEPLCEIDKSHWKDYEIEFSLIAPTSNNMEVFSCNKHSGTEWKRGGFVDLHVDKGAAVRWLKEQAPAYKGRRDQQR